MKTIYYPGWGVVWKIYSRENLKKSIWLPLVLTVVSFAICFFSGKASLDLIEYVASTISICGSKYAWVYFVRLCFNDGIEQL